jgi:hypothetical protein
MKVLGIEDFKIRFKSMAISFSGSYSLFYLWDYVIQIVSRIKVSNLNNLKQKIRK